MLNLLLISMLTQNKIIVPTHTQMNINSFVILPVMLLRYEIKKNCSHSNEYFPKLTIWHHLENYLLMINYDYSKTESAKVRALFRVQFRDFT